MLKSGEGVRGKRDTLGWNLSSTKRMKTVSELKVGRQMEVEMKNKEERQQGHHYFVFPWIVH